MADRSRSDSPTKQCTVEGCGRALRARGLCSTHYNQRLQTKQQRHAYKPTPCVVCGVVVIRYVSATPRYQTACSPLCRAVLQHEGGSERGYDWTVDAVRRALAAGATVVEPIDRLIVFERDGWSCYRCGIEVALGDCFARNSATVDHVVPLSRGGQHVMSNVMTCCLGCNSAKQDRAA